MKKRFCDCDQWSDAWFFSLSPEHKLAWIYLYSQCDSAGVIEVIPKLASVTIGVDVDFDALLMLAQHRIEVIVDAKWWLTGFIDFQYGSLSEASPPHKAVIKTLKKHGLYEHYQEWQHQNAKGKARVALPLGYPSPRVQDKDKEKEKDKGKDKEKDKGKESGTDLMLPVTTVGTFEDFWESVHRKVGKKAAQRAFAAAIKEIGKDTGRTPSDAGEWLVERMRTFAASPQARDPIKGQLHPATWLGQGRYDDDDAEWDQTPGQAGGLFMTNHQQKISNTNVAIQKFLSRDKTNER